MKSIGSIEELITALNDNDAEVFVKIAKQMNIPASDFEPYANWKPQKYTRNCIERTSKYEVLLLCWPPGSETSIHGHKNQRCWVHQVEGELVETRYRINSDGVPEEEHQMNLTPGKLSFMQDEMGYHTLKNKSGKPAISLHLYISPIDICDSYNTVTKGFLTTPLQYHSYKGVVNETFNPV